MTKIYDYILWYVRENHNFPSVREIRDNTEYQSTGTISQKLDKLCQEGKLEKTAAGSRGYKVVGGRWLDPKDASLVGDILLLENMGQYKKLTARLRKIFGVETLYEIYERTGESVT
jgi:hypothetical protein